MQRSLAAESRADPCGKQADPDNYVPTFDFLRDFRKQHPLAWPRTIYSEDRRFKFKQVNLNEPFCRRRPRKVSRVAETEIVKFVSNHLTIYT